MCCSSARSPRSARRWSRWWTTCTTAASSVLLAHPERSASFQREPELLATLVDMGALAQVTVGSLTGDFGRIPQRTAEMMVREELVHVLASDAHDDVHRAPVLDVNGALTADQFERMTTLVPEAIVAGSPSDLR